MHDLLEVTPSGLYCPQGDFYIDPWRRVPRAIVTHAHADHARPGCDRYLCASPGKLLLRERVGSRAPIDTLRFHESIVINGVHVSLASSGHILGAAQVVLEHGGVTWAVTGDYKTQADPTCDPFQQVEADVLITESTFGLPLYRWQDPDAIAAQINQWWRDNQQNGRTSVLLAYSLGKAQRLAAMIDPSIGQIVAHGAVMKMVRAYRDSGVRLPPIDAVPSSARKVGGGRALVIAPPSVRGSRWLRLFGDVKVAMVSGWMFLQSEWHTRGFEHGFAISDHADFPGLISVIEGSRARRVLVTHGTSESLAELLRQRGLDASVLPSPLTDDSEHPRSHPA